MKTNDNQIEILLSRHLVEAPVNPGLADVQNTDNDTIVWTLNSIGNHNIAIEMYIVSSIFALRLQYTYMDLDGNGTHAL